MDEIRYFPIYVGQKHLTEEINLCMNKIKELRRDSQFSAQTHIEHLLDSYITEGKRLLHKVSSLPLQSAVPSMEGLSVCVRNTLPSRIPVNGMSFVCVRERVSE